MKAGDYVNKWTGLLILAVKRLLFFSLPILIFLYLVYEVIFDLDLRLPLSRALVYALVIGLATMINYRNGIGHEKVDSFHIMEERVKEGPWKVLDYVPGGFILKPKFDYPYSLFSKDRVKVAFSDKMATMEGPKYYVEILSRDIAGRGNRTLRKIAGMGAFLFGVVILSIPIIVDSGLDWDLRIRYHNQRMENARQIEIDDISLLGNTVQNTNNYGHGVENEDYIFYVQDHLNLIRADKNLQNKEPLIQRGGGHGISRLNLVGDWLYYTSGETLNRMKLDGSENETIYKMGYTMDVTIKGRWIYFINFQDRSSIYRMDLNGQNLERFLEVNASSLSVYDDKLYFATIEDKGGTVQSVDLYGSDRKLEFETGGRISWFSIYKNNYYYIDHDYRLIKAPVGNHEAYQVIVDDAVSSYMIEGDSIYYSLHSQDVGYPGEGLYRMDLEGLNKEFLRDTQRVEGLAKVGGWILFHSSDGRNYPNQKGINLETGVIENIE